MISCIFFISLYRFRFGLALCYAIALVILFVNIQIYYRRYSRSEAEGDDSDARRVKQWQKTKTYYTCHMERENDALELLNSKVTLPAKSIFFHETSCKGGLTFREACAVESAAKAHPDYQINVFFTSAVSEQTLKNGSMSTLINYKNIKFARVLIKNFVKETPIEMTVDELSDEMLNIHMSKIMKYLTLYKYSGMYLSFDVIVARNIDLWNNWAVKEAPYTLSSDMFAFSNNKAGRKLARYALSILKVELINEKRDLWSFSGPSVISNLLIYWCSVKRVERMELSKCNDMAVFSPVLFYPIAFHNRIKYFQPADWQYWQNKSIITYYIWQRFTQYLFVNPDSLYGRIANEYCPITYSRFNNSSEVW